MDYRIKMFEKFDITDEEREFIRNIDAAGGLSMNSAEIHAILTNFYHAKQLEKSAKSNDRTATVMTWLTVAIAVFTAVQGVSALFQVLYVD